MDPIGTWLRICEALLAADVEDAIYAADDLAAWLRKGGYRPDGVPFANELTTFRQVLSAVLREVNMRGDGAKPV